MKKLMFFYTLVTAAMAYESEVVDLGQYKVKGSKANYGTPTAIQNKVLTKADIQNTNSQNLRDLLALQSGFTIDDDPATLTSTIKYNGVAGNAIKIIIDGVPAVTNYDGKVDVSQIPVNNVESVEIIASPLAAEYGSTGAGGVILLKTIDRNNQNNLQGKAFLSLESSGQSSMNVALLNNDPVHSYGLSFGLIDQKEVGENSRKPVWHAYNQPSLTSWWAFSRENWIVNTRYEGVYDTRATKANWSADAKSMAFDDNVGAFIAQDSLARDTEFSTWRHSLKNTYNWYVSDKNEFNSQAYLTLNLRDSEFKTMRYSTNQVENSTPGTSNKYINGGGNVNYLNQSFYHLPYAIGASVNHEWASGDKIINGAESFYHASLYGKASIVFPFLKLETSLRALYHSVFAVESMSGLPLLPAAGVTGKLWGAHQWSLAYGRGYRSPSMQEMFFSFHDGGSHNIDGNPNLKPELSHDYFGALSFNNQRFKQQINLFYHDIKNMITIMERADKESYHSYQNVHRFYSTGAQADQSYQLNKVFNVGVVLSLRGEHYDLSDETVLKDYFWIPEYSWNLNYFHSSGLFSLGFNHRYIAPQPVFVISGTDITQGEVESWHRLDLNAQQLFGQKYSKWRLNYGVKNLLNTVTLSRSVAASSHSGSSDALASRGRSYFVQLNYDISQSKK